MREVELDPSRNRFGDIWHVHVPDARPGHYYVYRMNGDPSTREGRGFDAEQWLLDPYGQAVAGRRGCLLSHQCGTRRPHLEPAESTRTTRPRDVRTLNTAFFRFDWSALFQQAAGIPSSDHILGAEMSAALERSHNRQDNW